MYLPPQKGHGLKLENAVPTPFLPPDEPEAGEVVSFWGKHCTGYSSGVMFLLFDGLVGSLV